MAMSSSTHQKVKLTEGSNLNDRPDSAKELFLYTHMLCPYAQTALLTLMCKVSYDSSGTRLALSQHNKTQEKPSAS